MNIRDVEGEKSTVAIVSQGKHSLCKSTRFLDFVPKANMMKEKAGRAIQQAREVLDQVDSFDPERDLEYHIKKIEESIEHLKATKVELEKEIAAKNLIRANKRDASPGSLSSDSTKEGWSDSDRRDALPHNTRNSEPQVSKKLRTSPPRKPRDWSAIKMSPSPQLRYIWHPAGTEIVDPEAAALPTSSSGRTLVNVI